jgi:hypothetical protein
VAGLQHVAECGRCFSIHEVIIGTTSCVSSKRTSCGWASLDHGDGISSDPALFVSTEAAKYTLQLGDGAKNYAVANQSDYESDFREWANSSPSELYES